MTLWSRFLPLLLCCAAIEESQDPEPQVLYQAPAGFQIDGLSVTPRLDHWAAVVSGKEGERTVMKAVIDGVESPPYPFVTLPVFSADGAHAAFTTNTSVFLDGTAVTEAISNPQSVCLRKDMSSITPLMELRSPTINEHVAISFDGKEVMWAVSTVNAPAVKDQRTGLFISGQKVHEDALLNWFGFTRDGWAVVSAQPLRDPYHQLARKGLPLATFRGVYVDSLPRISKDPPVFPHSDGIWINGQETKYELMRPDGSKEVVPWWASIAWSGDGSVLARLQSETVGSGANAQRQYRINVDSAGKRTFSGPRHDWCAYPVLSRNGKRVAYRARAKGRESVVIDGKEGPPYDSIGGIWLDASGKSSAYVATAKAATESKSFVVQDAKRHPLSGEVLEAFFAPTGTDAVAILARGAKRSVLPLDGLDRKGDLEWDWASRPAFSADAVSYAFIARQGEKLLRVERPVKSPKK
jgi:hypothetical protein